MDCPARVISSLNRCIDTVSRELVLQSNQLYRKKGRMSFKPHSLFKMGVGYNPFNTSSLEGYGGYILIIISGRRFSSICIIIVQLPTFLHQCTARVHSISLKVRYDYESTPQVDTLDWKLTFLDIIITTAIAKIYISGLTFVVVSVHFLNCDSGTSFILLYRGNISMFPPSSAFYSKSDAFAATP